MKDMTNVEAAYLAGLIDGEGWITIHKHKGRYPRYYLYCGIKMTDPAALRLLEAIADYRYKVSKYTRLAPNKDIYQINLYGDTAQEFLYQIEPYMLVKRKHALIALQFPTHIRGNNGFYEDQELMYEVLKDLNKRGRTL